MASQDSVLRFLTERGGRVKNRDLIEHFRSAFPSEPAKKAAAREAFKGWVDSVAVVKVDNGEKYVCLKKKFRGDGRDAHPAAGAEHSEKAESADAKQKIEPGSGVSGSGAEIGNRSARKGSDVRKLDDIPEASPSHVTAGKDTYDGTVPSDSEVKDPAGLEDRSDMEGKSNPTAKKELGGTPDQAPQELDGDPKVSKCLRRKPSQRSEQSADEGPGSNVSTPKGSRKNFLEHMMSSSPQVRRSVVLRNSVCLPSKSKDADATSLHVADDENASVALEPLEHEWMMCASDGEWESLRHLLDADPGLVGKKDFVTGFTCLHWAAKLGKAELLALLVSFATQHGVPVDVNARSSAGYTPLHLAAMHNHMEVVKLLVGAYDADVEVRDYSGKRASQYLRGKVAQDVLDIIGAGPDIDAQGTDSSETSGWRLSKVLQANLRPLKLLSHSTSEDDVSTEKENTGHGSEKVLRRKTSLRSLRPRLSKMRMRTQIVHSTSLFGHFERETEETSGSVRARPKSNLFG